MKRLITPLLLGLLLTGCGKQNQFVAPPPPEVEVQSPVVEDTTVYMELAGRTEAYARVQIQARVRGFLKSVEFKPGQFVKEGDLLFTIEPEQFEAAVETAEGNLAKARADLEIAITNYKRKKQAATSGAVSELEVLSAEADQKAAEAGVSIASAALQDAERDLSYTRITAPMSGRISDAKVDQGNLVGDSTTLLTTLISVQPIFMNVEFSERDILPYLKDLPNAENPTGTKNENGKDIPSELQLVLTDGTVPEERGRFDFIDNRVDPQTGTIRTKAIFANEKGRLADGIFARLRIPETVKEAVKIPANVIQRDLGGSFVLLVGEGNKVVRRTVIPSRFSLETSKIIKPYDEAAGTGIKPDEKIIVSNLQRAREGLEVKPVEAGQAGAQVAPAPGADADPEPKETEAEETETAPAKEKAE